MNELPKTNDPFPYVGPTGSRHAYPGTLNGVQLEFRPRSGYDGDDPLPWLWISPSGLDSGRCSTPYTPNPGDAEGWTSRYEPRESGWW